MMCLMLTGEECLGQCLYVAGVPGTGKTATLHEVIRQMRAKIEAKELAPFRYIEINALRLATPQHAYVQLYRVSLIISQTKTLNCETALRSPCVRCGAYMWVR